MSIQVQSVENLRSYFQGVAKRSEHHGPNVSEIIDPLLGLIVLYMDDDSDIEVRGYAGSSGNMLWVYIKGNRYAFRYEHADDTIEIHDNTFKGPLLHKINNQTSITQLKTIFQNL
jgi:hypothetical protein